jgi:hypothetical protein
MRTAADRKLPRFADFGRVSAPGLCIFPGVLDNISLEGCRVRFPAEVKPDSDSDYTVQILPSRKMSGGPLTLICHPMWKTVKGGTTCIGFMILRSPDTVRLADYIDDLDREAELDEDIENRIKDTECQFI